MSTIERGLSNMESNNREIGHVSFYTQSEDKKDMKRAADSSFLADNDGMTVEELDAILSALYDTQDYDLDA